MKTEKVEAAEASPSTAGRKPRADGIVSRSVILNAAARLATTRGLEGLSIGELAEHIGMSKSGLYAHFKSKEELELATIETAVEIFTNDVLRKVSDDVRGGARVLALTDAFLQHLAQRIFPGGCFFATVAAQLAARPGRARDRVLQVQEQWAGGIVAALHEAQEADEVARDADAEQLAFEITAMMLRANFAWIVTGEKEVLDRGRAGVKNVLARVAQSGRPRGRKKRNGRG